MKLPSSAADLIEPKKEDEGDTVTFFIDGKSYTKSVSEALLIVNAIITLVSVKIG